MKIAMIIILLFASSLVTLYASGCMDRNAAGNPPDAAAKPDAKPTVGTVLRDLGAAPASLMISEAMRPFFLAGLGFIVLGGLAFCFGGKGTGLTLMGVGALTTAAGVLFIQYPWAVLVVALVAGLAALAAVYGGWKSRRALESKAAALADADKALEVLAEATQKAKGGKEVKAGIKSMGTEAVAVVRRVVDPIKDKLAKAGKIKTA